MGFRVEMIEIWYDSEMSSKRSTANLLFAMEAVASTTSNVLYWQAVELFLYQ